MSFSLKTAAVAGVMLLATVSGAFAAHFSTDTKLLDSPHKWADVVSYADEGDFVKVISCGSSYCFVKYDGDKGYVKKWAIDFDYGPKKPWDDGPHGCIYGPYGYVCV